MRGTLLPWHLVTVAPCYRGTHPLESLVRAGMTGPSLALPTVRDPVLKRPQTLKIYGSTPYRSVKSKLHGEIMR